MVKFVFRGKKIICVIPARLASSRFPKKILADLNGKTLLQTTYEAAKAVEYFDQVVIAIDADETADCIERFGGAYFYTDVRCENGTQRLIELQKKGIIEGDIWVSWQADEPFITKTMIFDLLQTCDEQGVDVWTLKEEILFEENDPNCCKVVCDHRGFALYFSRSPIPFYRDLKGMQPYERHVGLYAYTSHALALIGDMGECGLEQAEMLEQLKFLFYGLKVFVRKTCEKSLGIDLPHHLELAEKFLKIENIDCSKV